METQIGIQKDQLAEVAQSLSKVLADEFVLYTKTRKAHWNVEGPDFYNKHKFFEDQYAQLEQIVDDVAERIRTIGHFAPGTLKEFLNLTQLTEQVKTKNDSASFIKELLADHESISINLREQINIYSDSRDQGTVDFLTGLLETHEKMAWMLRAHLA